MSRQPLKPKISPASKFMEQVRFIGALAKSPKTIGAVAPTSSETADLMASHISHPYKLPVLELGPGTGAITNAILRRGVREQDLYAIEYDAKFCRILSGRLPSAQIIQGNAFELNKALQAYEGQRFDCVISGLPLLNFDEPLRMQFLKGALTHVPKGRPLVQFSYGIRPPIEPQDPAIKMAKSRWIIKNLPPARVWTYWYE